MNERLKELLGVRFKSSEGHWLRLNWRPCDSVDEIAAIVLERMLVTLVVDSVDDHSGRLSIVAVEIHSDEIPVEEPKFRLVQLVPARGYVDVGTSLVQVRCKRKRVVQGVPSELEWVTLPDAPELSLKMTSGGKLPGNWVHIQGGARFTRSGSRVLWHRASGSADKPCEAFGLCRDGSDGLMLFARSSMEWLDLQARHEVDERRAERKTRTDLPRHDIARANAVADGTRIGPKLEASIKKVGLKVEFLSDRLATELRSISGVLDLDDPHSERPFIRALVGLVLSLSHAKGSEPYPLWPKALEKSEIVDLVRADWEALATAPWSAAITGPFAKLKMLLESGDRPQVWCESFERHYGFRLRTRDHSWLTGKFWIDPKDALPTVVRLEPTGPLQWVSRRGVYEFYSQKARAGRMQIFVKEEP